MRHKTTLAEARAFAPEAVDEIMAKLRKGKSAQRNCAPEDLDWFYDSCVVVSGPSTFGEMIERARNRPEPDPDQDLEQLVRERLEGWRVGLCACKGRWWGVSGKGAEGHVPESIVAEVRKRAAEDLAERKRYDALPQEQQDAEIQDLLRQLRKGPGFVEMHV